MGGIGQFSSPNCKLFDQMTNPIAEARKEMLKTQPPFCSSVGRVDTVFFTFFSSFSSFESDMLLSPSA